jgi:hypothetical protein
VNGNQGRIAFIDGKPQIVVGEIAGRPLLSFPARRAVHGHLLLRRSEFGLLDQCKSRSPLSWN